MNWEIDEGTEYIGYKEALSLILSNTNPAKTEDLSLYACAGYVSAEDVVALVDSPTNNVSLKDGFAVKALDVENASPQSPAILGLAGTVFAGGRFEGQLSNGQTVKVCSGALLPVGTDAVVAAEFIEEAGPSVYIKTGVTAGQNIFFAGENAKKGSAILKKGDVLLPFRLGLAAAGGISHLKVFQKPRTTLMAIGDEVIAPGQVLKEGQVYASNLVNIAAWLSTFNVPCVTAITGDNIEAIRNELMKSISQTDVIITNGGAWESERDFIVRVLDGLDWKMLFRHVRMGPGKGISFGLWEDKPVFCLPGGPTSNESAFLHLALPGVLHLAGLTKSPLQTVSARLTQDVTGRHLAWTEFHKASLAQDTGEYPSATPYAGARHTKSRANLICLICKPEGVEALQQGQIVNVQVMAPTFAGLTTTDWQ